MHTGETTLLTIYNDGVIVQIDAILKKLASKF